MQQGYEGQDADANATSSVNQGYLLFLEGRGEALHNSNSSSLASYLEEEEHT